MLSLEILWDITEAFGVVSTFILQVLRGLKDTVLFIPADRGDNEVNNLLRIYHQVTRNRELVKQMLWAFDSVQMRYVV